MSDICALPQLTPSSTTSTKVLPATGSSSDVLTNLPYGIYTSDAFISGAVDQVSYTYQKLAGNIVDIDLQPANIYSAYEEAVLEYSYLINIHQAKNALGNLLGNTTASFDEDGEVVSGPEGVELNYPRFTFQYTQRVADGLVTETGLGGDLTVYSASFEPTYGVSEYDLQSIVSSSVASGSLTLDTGDTVGTKKITIRRMFYKTPLSMWRFFAIYGGLNVVGNLSNYGMYSDDATYEIVPTWQNKLQAMMYEDSIYTRASHYSYEIKNNKLKLFPPPTGIEPETFWFHFTVEKDAWEEYADRRRGADGVNNMNTLPFGNIPFENINSIGKQWIRRYALAITKEMLGHSRGKTTTLPIPGEPITLNYAELWQQAKAEKDALREELNKVLNELTYAELAKRDTEIAENASKTMLNSPLPIYIG